MNLNDKRWLKNYDILNEYITVWGYQPKYNVEYRNVKIGIWLRTQRKLYNSNILLEERYLLLKKIGVTFEKPKSLLKLKREKSGKTRKELAMEIGVSKVVLETYEDRIRKLSSAKVKVIYALTETLKCDFKEIVELDFKKIDKEISRKLK